MKIPRHKEIDQRGEFGCGLNLKDIVKIEERLFDKLIADNNLSAVISRYRVRETSVLKSIAMGLGLTTDIYEGAVRKLIIDDEETKDYFKKLLSRLTKLVENKKKLDPKIRIAIRYTNKFLEKILVKLRGGNMIY